METESMLHHLLTLARVSNLPTVWSNCLAGWLISGAHSSWQMVWLLAGATLLYAAGCTLNDAFDVKWDEAHRPERIIPSGKLSRSTVWTAGLLEMAAGLALIYAGGVSSWWPPAGLAIAILFYDAWHKQSPLSVIVMGACRWLLYISAAACAGGNLKPVMILGTVLWLYIIVLSLVARGEARRGAGVPRTRFLLLLIPCAVAAAAVAAGSGPLPVTYAVVCSAVGLTLMLYGVTPSPGDWVNRLLAGIPILDLALYLSVLTSPGPTVVYIGCVLLSLQFQRWFQAT